MPSLTADTIGWLTAARRKWTCRLLRQGISEQCCKPPLAWRSVRSRNFGTQNLIVFGDCIGGYPHNTSIFVRCSEDRCQQRRILFPPLCIRKTSAIVQTPTNASGVGCLPYVAWHVCVCVLDFQQQSQYRNRRNRRCAD